MKPKYIVLDRDGVINVDLFDYVMDVKDFKFEEGSYEALIELGKNLMNRIIEDTKDIAKVETHPKFEGRQMIMIIQPN